MSPRSLPTTLKPIFSLSLCFKTTTLLLHFLLANTFVNVVHGVVRNATIDDHYGDSLTNEVPAFLPRTGSIWEGEECAGCRVKPDARNAFRNTYNAATYRPEAGINPVSVQMRFTGTAIYAFLTLANNCGEGITTKTEANFTVDSEEPFLFRHEPDMSRTDFIYQHLAFSRAGLEHTAHTLNVEMSGPEEHLFLNFDYALYTYDDALFPVVATVTSTSSSSSSSQPSSISASRNGKPSLAGPIAGGVAGGVVIFVVFILALFFIRRRYRRPPGPQYHNPDTVQSVGQSQHRQYPSISTTPPSIAPYANQTLSSSTSSLRPTIITANSLSTATGSSGSGSRRPVKHPHIQPFTQLRPSGDGRGSGRGHVPQQPSLAQTQWSQSTQESSQLAYTSASSHSGQRAPVIGPSPLALPPHNAADGDLEQRVEVLQQSINSMIANIQVEQEALSRRGLSEEQINASLDMMRRNLASLAEQMSSLQERRRGTWNTEYSNRREGEDLPEYESIKSPTRRLSDS